MKVGIIGCGVAMEHHITGILSSEGAELVGCCDLDQKRAEAAVEKIGMGRPYTDFKKMIADEKLDTVHVLTPPKTHIEVALYALNQKVNVLVEKPMAITAAEVDQMESAAKENDVKLCVMHNHKFDPQIKKAKEILAKGEIGKVLSVECRYFIDKEKMEHEHTNVADHWIQRLPTGIFGEYAPHMLYLVLPFLDEVTSVKAVKRSPSEGNTDGIFGMNVILDAGDNFGNLILYDNMDYAHFYVRVYGTKGALHINMFDLTIVKERQPGNMPRVLAKMYQTVDQSFQNLFSTTANVIKILTGKLKRRPGHKALIGQFYKSIANNTAVPVVPSEGKDVVRVLELINASVEETA